MLVNVIFAAFVAVNVIYIGSTSMWFFRLRRCTLIEKRDPVLSLFVSAVMALFLTIVIPRLAFLKTVVQFPCYIELLISYMTLPTLELATQLWLLQVALDSAASQKQLGLLTGRAELCGTGRFEALIFRAMHRVLAASDCLRGFLLGGDKSPRASTEPSGDVISKSGQTLLANDAFNEYQAEVFLRCKGQSFKWTVFFFVIFQMAFTAACLIPQYEYLASLDACPGGFDALYGPLVVEVGLLFIINPAASYLTRNVKDNLGLRWVTHLGVYSAHATYVLTILIAFVAVEPFLTLERILGGHFVIWLFLIELHTLLVTLPAWWAHEALNTAATNVAADEAKADFARVFSDSEVYARFKESVARDFCLENVVYYEDSTAFLRSCGAPTDLFLESTVLPTRTHPEVRRDLKKLRFKFFANDAPLQLNISSELRENFVESLKALHACHNVDEAASIFSTRTLPAVCAVRNHVVTLLFQNSWPRFQKELKDSPRIKLKEVL